MDNQSNRLIGSTGVSLAAVLHPATFPPDHPVEASPGQAGFVSPSIASARLTDLHVDDFLQSDERFFHTQRSGTSSSAPCNLNAASRCEHNENDQDGRVSIKAQQVGPHYKSEYEVCGPKNVQILSESLPDDSRLI